MEEVFLVWVLGNFVRFNYYLYLILTSLNT